MEKKVSKKTKKKVSSKETEAKKALETRKETTAVKKKEEPKKVVKKEAVKEVAKPVVKERSVEDSMKAVREDMVKRGYKENMLTTEFYFRKDEEISVKGTPYLVRSVGGPTVVLVKKTLAKEK